MILTIFTMMISMFYNDNKEFFHTAADQMQDGASWEYVGPQDPDPSSKSLTLQGTEGSEPYILFKLKK